MLAPRCRRGARAEEVNGPVVKRVIDRMPSIKSVMTPFPHCIDIAASASDARRTMAEHRIRHLPVIDEGRLVGVLSDTALAQLEIPESTPRAVEPRVSEARLIRICVVELTEPLDRVLTRMVDERLEAVLVVKSGKLAGIFTLTDACRRFAEFLQSIFPEGGGDNAA